MTKKELKLLAKRIYSYQLIVDNPDAPQDKQKEAKEEIIRLTGYITNLEDMFALDELILKLIKKNS